MIRTVVRIAFLNFLRDRVALALTFVLPIVFFSIFAFVFGGVGSDGVDRVKLAVADEDDSEASRRFIAALQADKSLDVRLASADARLQTHVLPQDTTHFLDGVGISLRGMARVHDQLGFDRLDVGARILHHAVVPLLHRPVPLDRDDGVDRDGRRDRDLLQGSDEVVPWRHVVNRRWDDRVRAREGVPVPGDVRGHPGEGEG